MILIDGARYELWSPKEESELEAIVREHSKDIWGPNSLYLESSKLRTEAGVGSRPDAFVLLVDGSPECHIVEVELSSHPLYEHVVAQVIKFGSGLANSGTQHKLVNLIYDGLNANVSLAGQVKGITGSTDLHKFLSDLLARPPVLTIVIEEKTRLLDEAVQQLPSQLFMDVKVVELRTFCRDGCGMKAHAHLFEPIWSMAREVSPVEPPGTPPPLSPDRSNWAKLCRERGWDVGGDSAHRIVLRRDPTLHRSIPHSCKYDGKTYPETGV